MKYYEKLFETGEGSDATINPLLPIKPKILRILRRIRISCVKRHNIFGRSYPKEMLTKMTQKLF
jgi:hypothetical protein